MNFCKGYDKQTTSKRGFTNQENTLLLLSSCSVLQYQTFKYLNTSPAFDMETFQEIIPFAKDMMSQKPSRGMLKVYLVGSTVAVLGTVVGLVQTVCHPFSSVDDAALDMELAKLVERERREAERRSGRDELPLFLERSISGKTISEEPSNVLQRSAATRLHAS